MKWLEGIETVSVTAGASTPTLIVREVIAFLEKFNPEDPSTHHPERKFLLEKILPKIKNPYTCGTNRTIHNNLNEPASNYRGWFFRHKVIK